MRESLRIVAHGNGLRAAPAVLGGLGALVGMAKGLLSVAFWLFVGLSTGDLGDNLYLTLIVTFEGVTAIFCAIGFVGVIFEVRGGQRLGAWPMLIGAMGVAASVSAYVLLLPIVTTPIPPAYPGIVFYMFSTTPIVALLIAAALTFLTNNGSRGE